MNVVKLRCLRVASLIGLLAGATIAVCGCQQKMADQPSYKPLQPCDFFPDGRSARPIVLGSVARGHLRTDLTFFTGRIQAARATNAPATPADIGTTPSATDAKVAAGANGSDVVPPSFRDEAAFVREFPVPVGEEMIRHGYNRYMVYCVACHDPLGSGNGRIIERGYSPPPSFHVERLRSSPPGRIFAVISEGYGSMPSYANQVPPADRWAIVAYVRSLQLSQHYPESELTSEMRQEYSSSVAQGSTSHNRDVESQERAP